MCSLLLAGLLLFGVGILRAEVVGDVARCSNETVSRLNLTEAADGAKGRYDAELCGAVEPEFVSWQLSLYVYDKGYEYKCKPPPPRIFVPGQSHSHSVYEEQFVRDGNCSHVCLNTTFDLLFNGCYVIQSLFMTKENHKRQINFTYIPIEHSYTREYILNNQASVVVEPIDSENVTVVWHTGVPFKSFEFRVYQRNNPKSEVVEERGPLLVTEACEAAPARVSCRARLAPAAPPAPAACYQLELYLHHAWVHGLLQNQSYVKHVYCAARAAPAGVRAARVAWWAWAASGAAAACAAGAAGAALGRLARRRALHKRVLQDWLMRRSEPAPAAEQPAAPARRHVLLLYAREGPAAARLSACLRDLLRGPHAQVHDIFSAEVLAAAAAAPAEWVRGMLARDDVAVLLLQTPALAALYLPAPAPARPVAEPLLGARVAYRAPHYGDVLLQCAVRLAVSAARAHSDYHKYYVATVSELPTEVVPQLVPFRRYALPGAAELLARDAAGAAPEAGALAALSAAAAEFAAAAAARPDYLLDDLVLL